MVSVAENLGQRSKGIIGVVVSNSSDMIKDILDLDMDVKNVHILGGIVVMKHDITNKPEDTAYSLGYKAQGNLYPVVFITVNSSDVTVANDKWEFACKFIEAAEKKLQALGLSQETVPARQMANG